MTFAGATTDYPRIGYDNFVEPASITADQEDDDFPAVNLANPNTSLEWRGTSAALQYVAFLTGLSTAIDYLAVARHNFGTAGIAVSVEGKTTAGGSYSVISVAAFIPADDAPIMFQLTSGVYHTIRLKLAAGSELPRAAVVYSGALLTMPRTIWVGHVPVPYARRTIAITGKAESGDFLGRVVTGEYREGMADFPLLDPAWYRTYMDPFLDFAQELPFFFAWRPSTYPLECGFVVLTNDPEPVAEDPHHMFRVTLQMRGVP